LKVRIESNFDISRCNFTNLKIKMVVDPCHQNCDLGIGVSLKELIMEGESKEWEGRKF